MAEQFANHPGTTLAAAITTTARPVTFFIASAANLPTSGNFRMLIDSEIFLITAISGTSLTGSNVEGTAAATHVSGTAAGHILTAGGLTQLEADTQAQALAANVQVAPHANRASLPASNYANGTIFFETDRNALYMVVNGLWIWVAGLMVVSSALQPSDLGTSDIGFTCVDTDTQELQTWTGLTWVTITAAWE